MGIDVAKDGHAAIVRLRELDNTANAVFRASYSMHVLMPGQMWAGQARDNEAQNDFHDPHQFL